LQLSEPGVKILHAIVCTDFTNKGLKQSPGLHQTCLAKRAYSILPLPWRFKRSL
jgi:hypothetical protein